MFAVAKLTPFVAVRKTAEQSSQVSEKLRPTDNPERCPLKRVTTAASRPLNLMAEWRFVKGKGLAPLQCPVKGRKTLFIA
jgi:hypothetical protein